jgi:type II secretory ATPase GspE/PulE/Tfp pilus assembly ATPase PilB-like protein
MRLLDMGIPSFLVSAALTGVLAQRLVRKLCQTCKEPYSMSTQEKLFIQKYTSLRPTSWRAAGCEACSHVGYKGRIGVFEFLQISPLLQTLITNKAGVDIMHEQAHKDGMVSLINHALEHVNQGTTSISELIRTII